MHRQLVVPSRFYHSCHEIVFVQAPIHMISQHILYSYNDRSEALSSNATQTGTALTPVVWVFFFRIHVRIFLSTSEYANWLTA